MDAENVIATRELTKRYNGQAAVDGLTFSVRAGEVYGFLGPNGAGKTTTLLMLLGLTEPTGGQVRVMGIDPAREPIKVKRQIGYLQENMGFYRDLSGWQSLNYIAELNGIYGADARARIEAALVQTGLENEAHKKVGAYSRGMRQRLGFAEILLKNPRIAFLDEPTLGLDPDATNRMLEMIQDLCRRQKMTVLLSSHLLHQVQRICHRVGIMIGGHLVAEGPMQKLAAEKLGVGQEQYTLEEIYMKYFKES